MTSNWRSRWEGFRTASRQAKLQAAPDGELDSDSEEADALADDAGVIVETGQPAAQENAPASGGVPGTATTGAGVTPP